MQDFANGESTRRQSLLGDRWGHWYGAGRRFAAGESGRQYRHRRCGYPADRYRERVMIYLEFIERDRQVPIEVFRYMGDQQSSWVEPDADRMILQLGRTLRCGPQPSYLAFWKIAGLHRLDDWEHYFGGKDWYDNPRSQAMHRSIHIQRAGLYRELTEGPIADGGLQVVEFFDTDNVNDDATARAFEERAARFNAATLNLLLLRIGVYGPDPAHLAVWTFPSYAALEAFLPDQSVLDGVTIRTAGIYRKLGREIL